MAPGAAWPHGLTYLVAIGVADTLAIAFVAIGTRRFIRRAAHESL